MLRLPPLRLPPRFAAVILCFAPLFFQRSWRHAEMLLIGAILTPGRRTVTSILRITGLCRERRFVDYDPVLKPSPWSGAAAKHVRFGVVLDGFLAKWAAVLRTVLTIEHPRDKDASANR